MQINGTPLAISIGVRVLSNVGVLAKSIALRESKFPVCLHDCRSIFV